MNKKQLILILAIILLLILAGIFLFFSENFTGKTIATDRYSYTKAICNETNYCEDYEITCENNEIMELVPTGFAVQQREDWNDPRGENFSESLC